MNDTPTLPDEPPAEHLTLKWGVPKAWRLRKPALEKLREYAALGWSGGAMTQPNTPEHKRVLCELIDVLSCPTVKNDWTNEDMTKEQAKAYVLSYGKTGAM